MNGDTGRLPVGDNPPEKRALFRPWLLASVLGVAVFLGWLAWPSGPRISPYELSREDGKPRFYSTTYSKTERPARLTLPEQLAWEWKEYLRRRAKSKTGVYFFPPRPVEPCSISGLLNQCMEVSGTRYLIAVEIAGAVDFGNTNTMNGTQWVAAFEHALETSGPVVCYDYAKKSNFQDTLLLVRESPGVVKVVPRTKLAEYQKAGLVRAESR